MGAWHFSVKDRTFPCVGCLQGLHAYAGGEDVFGTAARATRARYMPLSDVRILVHLIAGATFTEIDRQRIDERVSEAFTQYQEALSLNDEPERMRFLAD
jgi:hypothetical protein